MKKTGNIAEIFCSYQGEGIYVGQQQAFIRFAGCNLRCKYCSHFSGAGDVGRDLPAEEWLRFFEELNRCAVLNVTLQGGEPFCREDLEELIEGIVRNRMRFNILSNGTLITDEIAAFLA